MTIIYAIALLGILIFVHELGHFLFAKLMGVKVIRFSLGFGPKIVGITHKETEYQISAVPLGGYVKMLGQSDNPDEEEEVPEEDKSRAFNHQPVWKRFLIVFAGPVFNLFFASLIFMLILLSGVPALYPDIGQVIANTPAAQAGLMKNDRIIEINGNAIKQWDEMTGIVHKNPGVPLDFKIKRKDDILSYKITPERKKAKTIFLEEKEVGLIGIAPLGSTFTKRFGLAEAIPLGFVKTYEYAALNIIGLIKIIQSVLPADSIGGPILIFQMAGKQADEGILSFFAFMAIISVTLGVMNLLPIPVLDGGHLMFLAIEAVRRKPLAEKTMINAQKIGISFLIALMAFAFYNDIVRLITGKTLP